MAIHKLYLATLVYFLLSPTWALAMRPTPYISKNNARTSSKTGSVVCGSAPEGETLQITCPSGATISHITFASFGNPTGSCGSFSRGTCDSPISLPLVQTVCLGKQSCRFNASEAEFGSIPCERPKRLAIEVIC